MNLKDPTRKKRVHQPSQRPFPIPPNKNDEWVMYTAHLSASATCIAHPNEMAAIYCMGFFGKGSLSRGFPCFGKRRFGAPPQLSERQWKRRKQWLEDVKKLETEPFLFSPEDSAKLDSSEDDPKPCSSPSQPPEENKDSKIAGEVSKTIEKTSEIIENHEHNLDLKNEENSLKFEEKVEEKNVEGLKNQTDSPSLENLPKTDENIPEKNTSVIINNKQTFRDSKSPENSSKSEEKTDDKNDLQILPESESSENSLKKVPAVLENDEEIDEVVLDSTEDEEVCEIVDNDLNKSMDTESQDEICVLNDEVTDSLKPDHFLHFMELPQDKPKVNPDEMLVLPDSDSDTEIYLKNIKPRLETEGFPVTETLQLTFEETFFLMYGLGCLQVVNYDGQFFSIIEAWNHFNEQDEDFFSKYIVYHYFRSKGWIVRPGVKCSGDFMLYKKGPQFYHASYVVFIEVVDADSLLRDDSKMRRDASWRNIHSINRLAQSVAKELLIVQVLWPSTVPRKSNPVRLEALSEFTVRELLMRRWNPNETCETIPLNHNEDEDSEDEDSS